MTLSLNFRNKSASPLTLSSLGQNPLPVPVNEFAFSESSGGIANTREGEGVDGYAEMVNVDFNSSVSVSPYLLDTYGNQKTRYSRCKFISI